MTRNPKEKEVQDWFKKNKIVVTYETAKIPYTLTKYYIPDWSRPPIDKVPGIHIEYKGYLRPQDQVKMKAVKRQNPDLNICIVFQDASKKIRKGSKTTYGEWATKNGFPWTEGLPLKKWFK